MDIQLNLKRILIVLKKLFMPQQTFLISMKNDVIVTNARHYEALIRAQESIERVIEGINNNFEWRPFK